MIITARIVSWLSLGATLIPPILVFGDRMTLDQMKLWMFIATVTWFVATPIWMKE